MRRPEVHSTGRHLSSTRSTYGSINSKKLKESLRGLLTHFFKVLNRNSKTRGSLLQFNCHLVTPHFVELRDNNIFIHSFPAFLFSPIERVPNNFFGVRLLCRRVFLIFGLYGRFRTIQTVRLNSLK